MQNISHAVMAQRVEPHDSLDFFPTPPWATRALLYWLETYDNTLDCLRAWEPACGAGHMVAPLKERFDRVYATDVHDYSRIWPDQEAVFDFLMPGMESTCIQAYPPHYVITNPPFRLASEFAHRALSIALKGTALLCRSVFLEGGQRWRDLYDRTPPSDVLIFCERVPMLKGRLDRKASSATSYAWFVWRKDAPQGTHLHWIPPGTRKRLERDEDYA